MFLSKKICIPTSEFQKLNLLKNMAACNAAYNRVLSLVFEFYKAHDCMPRSSTLCKMFFDDKKVSRCVTGLNHNLVLSTVFEAYDNFRLNVVMKGLRVPYRCQTSSTKTLDIHLLKVECVGVNKVLFDGLFVNNGNDSRNIIKHEEMSKMISKFKIIDKKISYDGKKFYFIFTYNAPKRELLVPNRRGIGIDVGLENLASLSNGKVYENIVNSPKFRFLVEARKTLRVKILQKKMALLKTRQDEDFATSRDLREMQTKLARIERRMKCIRKDYIEQITKSIIMTNPEFICVETLDVNTMFKDSPSYNEYLQETSMEMFIKKLEYKARLYGVPLIKAPRNFASTKICCQCMHKKDTMLLKDRVYSCSNCGILIDRDVNAAVNLYKYGFWVYHSKRDGSKVSFPSLYSPEFKSWKQAIAMYIYNGEDDSQTVGVRNYLRGVKHKKNLA